jgi:hypothetical protein
MINIPFEIEYLFSFLSTVNYREKSMKQNKMAFLSYRNYIIGTEKNDIFVKK